MEASMKTISEMFDEFLKDLREVCPEGSDFDKAKENLELAFFWAKKASATAVSDGNYAWRRELQPFHGLEGISQ